MIWYVPSNDGSQPCGGAGSEYLAISGSAGVPAPVGAPTSVNGTLSPYCAPCTEMSAESIVEASMPCVSEYATVIVSAPWLIETTSGPVATTFAGLTLIWKVPRTAGPSWPPVVVLTCPAWDDTV